MLKLEASTVVIVVIKERLFSFITRNIDLKTCNYNKTIK